MKCFLILFAALVLAFGQTEAQQGDSDIVWKKELNNICNSVLFSSSGDTVFNNVKNTLQYRQTSSGELIFEKEMELEIEVMDISSDGKKLVFAGEGHYVKLWDIEKGDTIRTFQIYNDERPANFFRDYSSIHFSPDGSKIIATFGEEAKPYGYAIWETDSGLILKTDLKDGLNDNLHNWYRSAFSPDGKYYVTSLKFEPFDIVLWDASTYEIIGVLGKSEKRPESRINKLKFLQYNLLAASESGYAIRIWNITDNEIFSEIKLPHLGSSITFDFPTDLTEKVITRGIYNGIQKSIIWNLETGKKIKEYEYYGRNIDISSDNKLFLGNTGIGSREIILFRAEWSPTTIMELATDDSGIIHPNPVTGILQIELSNEVSDLLKIKIVDIKGNTMFADQVIPNSEQIQLDVSDYPSGIYFINLQNSSYTKSYKFVKE